MFRSEELHLVPRFEMKFRTARSQTSIRSLAGKTRPQIDSWLTYNAVCKPYVSQESRFHGHPFKLDPEPQS
jgi:hypothetical protein